MRNLTLLCSLIFGMAVTAQSINTAELDSLFDHYGQHEAFLGNVEIRKGKNTLYKRSVGYQDLDQKIKNTEKTIFLIGSITKTYTATLILQLMEEGKLDLSDKLAKFYPDIPNAELIDFEMLLRHRSGLFNYTDEPTFIQQVIQPISKEGLLDKFKSYRTVFAPNEKYEYSNTNYILLGFIIEDVTHDSYENQLQKRIIDKLGLKATYLGRPKDRAYFAKSYMRKGGDWQSTIPEWNVDWAWSAGALSTTLEDLAIFYEALFDGKLISKESLAKMIDLKDNYGLGISGIPYYDKLFYGHTGGIESYMSSIGYNPKDEILLVQVVNGPNYLDPNDLSIQLLNSAYGKPIERKPVEVKQAVLKAYEGNYANPDFPLLIKVFVKNEELYGQAAGQGAFPLTPYSDTYFEFKPAFIKMSFFKKDGVQSFHFKQSNLQLDFEKKKE